MKLVKVTFKSAKLIFDNKKDKEICSTAIKNKKRRKHGKYVKNREHFVDRDHLIKFECITNMLHVLFGERPVPSYREVPWERLEAIDNIARNGYMKIDTQYERIGSKGQKVLLTEMRMGKKMPSNSENGNAYYSKYLGGFTKGRLTWGLLKRIYASAEDSKHNNFDKYNDIINHIKYWINDDDVMDKMTIVDALCKIGDTKYKDEASNYFKKLKLTPLMYIVNHLESPRIEKMNVNCKAEGAIMVNTNVIDELSLDGEFIFEMTDGQYDRIMSGTLIATYLDGGFAKVSLEPLDEFDVNFDEYKKISEL